MVKTKKLGVVKKRPQVRWRFLHLKGVTQGWWVLASRLVFQLRASTLDLKAYTVDHVKGTLNGDLQLGDTLLQVPVFVA